MKKYFLFLFFYLLSMNSAFAQKDTIDGKSYILCINSYTESSPWSSGSFPTLRNSFKKTLKLLST